MSLEQVLLIAFLVVLPLMQHLVKYVRRQKESEEHAEGRSPSSRRPPMKVEEHRPLAVPPRTSHPAARGAALVGIPLAAAKLPDLTVGPSGRPSIPVAGHSHPFELHRAIVLMTLVGPCRAASPHDWSDR
jgi:hypothetical protein